MATWDPKSGAVRARGATQTLNDGTLAPAQ
jgi:hypothetical protein